MLDFFFRGFVKDLERSAKDVSRDFVKSSGNEVRDLVDNKLSPLADKLDYIAQERIKPRRFLRNPQQIPVSGKHERQQQIQRQMNSTQTDIVGR